MIVRVEGAPLPYGLLNLGPEHEPILAGDRPVDGLPIAFAHPKDRLLAHATSAFGFVAFFHVLIRLWETFGLTGTELTWQWYVLAGNFSLRRRTEITRFQNHCQVKHIILSKGR